MMGFRRDEAITQRRIDRAVMRRVLTFIRPYKKPLVAFVVTVVLGSIATAVTPLLLKELLDKAIPPAHHNRHLVMLIALGAVGARALQRRPLARPAVLLGAHRGRADLRPAGQTLRPRAAHADRVLHPDADRLTPVAVEQRRRRRAAGGDQHTGHGPAEFHPTRCDTHDHVPAQLADNTAHVAGSAGVHLPRSSARTAHPEAGTNRHARERGR